VAQKWKSPEEDELLRECLANRLSVAKTAAKMGRSQDAVWLHAKALGLSFARTVDIAVSAAIKIDARADRAQFRAEFMEDLKKLKAQMWTPSLVYSFGGKDNTFEEATLDQPAIADQYRLVQAINVGLNAIERLEKMDADVGISDAAGMLDRISEAIKKAADDQASVL
jgi:hypothetical protein